MALKKVTGSSVGTCVLPDFDSCDLLLFFGQNTGTNSPRFLHKLQEAKERGCRIVTLNPIRERGLVEFVSPQNPVQMTVTPPTTISDLYLQVKPGGDVAARTLQAGKRQSREQRRLNGQNHQKNALCQADAGHGPQIGPGPKGRPWHNRGFSRPVARHRRSHDRL